MLRWIGFRAIVLDRSAPADANTRSGFDGGFVDDPELVRRSAAVLEAYLRHTSGPARDSGAGLPAIEGRTNGSGRAKANGHAESPDPEIMPQDEALAILGLEPGATEREISQAHRRIAQAIHPDGGGSRYLAIKVDRAKESLLRSAGEPSARIASKAPLKRKPSRRRTQRPPA
jgi:hypothetical protein